MGALVAILQNDPNLMGCQIHRLEPVVALTEPDRLPDAYGFGYFTTGDVLLGKRPTGAPGLLTLSQLVGDVDTDVLVAHARYATVGNHKDENTQPYRFRRWLFAHDGSIEGFAAVKPLLLDYLPDFLRRNVEGDTDTEHAFMVFLQLLREQGRLDDLDIDAESAGDALARTVRQIDAWCRQAGAQRPSALNLVATNGRILAATRRGRPLSYALLEGIVPCELHGVHDGGEGDARMRPHRLVKAVCFASRLLSPGGFLEVPENSSASVSRDLRVSIRPIANH
jgi:predicted glutamine amidotransferase